jgi:hypothetical protein
MSQQDCNCFEHRLVCSNCKRDIDLTKYVIKPIPPSPQQLELHLPMRNASGHGDIELGSA